MNKRIVRIELPIDFIVSDCHGVDCKVTLYGRERYDGPYMDKTFDASDFVDVEYVGE